MALDSEPSTLRDLMIDFISDIDTKTLQRFVKRFGDLNDGTPLRQNQTALLTLGQVVVEAFCFEHAPHAAIPHDPSSPTEERVQRKRKKEENNGTVEGSNKKQRPTGGKNSIEAALVTYSPNIDLSLPGGGQEDISHATLWRAISASFALKLKQKIGADDMSQDKKTALGRLERNTDGALDDLTVYWIRVFGEPGLTHLSALYHTHETCSVEIESPGVDERARQYTCFHKTLESYKDIHKHDRVVLNNSKSRLFSLVNRSTFYEEFVGLYEAAIDEKSKLRAEFSSIGITQSRGRSWKSLVGDYWIYCYSGLDPKDYENPRFKKHRKSLNYELALGRILNSITKAFSGRGILALLSSQELSSLRQHSHTIPLLAEAIVDAYPVLPRICNRIDSTLITPLMQGKQPATVERVELPEASGREALFRLLTTG